MNITDFLASRRPASPETLAAAAAEHVEFPEGAEVWEYGEGWILHELAGQYFPHAWWYAPVAKDSLIAAETVLWEWRAEFED